MSITRGAADDSETLVSFLDADDSADEPDHSKSEERLVEEMVDAPSEPEAKVDDVPNAEMSADRHDLSPSDMKEPKDVDISLEMSNSSDSPSDDRIEFSEDNERAEGGKDVVTELDQKNPFLADDFGDEDAFVDASADSHDHPPSISNLDVRTVESNDETTPFEAEDPNNDSTPKALIIDSENERTAEIEVMLEASTEVFEEPITTLDAIAGDGAQIPSENFTSPSTDVITALEQIPDDVGVGDTDSTESVTASSLSADTEESQQITSAQQGDPIAGEQSRDEAPMSGVDQFSSAQQDGFEVIETPTMEVFPPPVPSSAVVVQGSMVVTEDDSDSDSDEDEAAAALPPPLNLDRLGDDEDEIELDMAVVQTIQVERKLAPTATVAKEKANPLLDAIPVKVDAFQSGFADEVRVALAVNDDIAMPEPVPSKEPHEESSERMFGIGYRDIRKKRGSGPGVSIFQRPAFPDEKDFERELSITNDLTFSARADATHVDDEFAINDSEDNSGVSFPIDNVEERREAARRQKEAEEQKVLDELRRVTEKEREENARESKPVEPPPRQDVDEGTQLSLKELHSIYKRGFGDQEVLMDDESPPTNRPNAESKNNAAATMERKLSFMEKVMSKQPVHTQVITEADEDGEGEEEEEDRDRSTAEGSIEDFAGVRETLINREPSSADERDTADEWKEIQLLEQSVKATRSSVQRDDASEDLIAYEEALDFYLHDESFESQRDSIVPEDIPAASSCFSCFGRPRLTFPGAMDERDRVFCCAATAYDPNSQIYYRMLQTIFRKLMRSSRRVPSMGSHWEEIGFQGTDPSTDLRGCGVLSLLQMLYLVQNHSELALSFHSLSHHPVRHFPMACALINVTLQCVVALRSGTLYRECNKVSSIIKAINSLYVAITTKLMHEIKNSSTEIPLILKSVLDEGKLFPDKIIEELGKPAVATFGGGRPSQSKAKSQGQGQASSSTNIEFTEIALQSSADD
ncbi:TPA: hypothetical protein N0F65_000281 [Lagenidium giganteum]|uniref:ELMO domain-containing protein n=1 Tax=Lagenidium giganteum TaxID=4803 RepID=A0AAV2Z7N9_9STRA|nr:TPA: hypothetical protein N0F65_000281 [Lagenidium giganteum]